jgi:prevent-host-death family protein
MKTISAKDAKNAFGTFLDSAQREPVMITKHDRPIGIFLSMHDVHTLLQIDEVIEVRTEFTNIGNKAYLLTLQTKLRESLTTQNGQ